VTSNKTAIQVRVKERKQVSTKKKKHNNNNNKKKGRKEYVCQMKL